MKEASSSEHYNQCEIEPIEYIMANGYGTGFCIGNIIKYVSRYKQKNGVEDLYKARQYLDWLIEIELREEGKNE